MKENSYCYLAKTKEKVKFIKLDPQSGEAVIEDANGNRRAVNPSSLKEVK